MKGIGFLVFEPFHRNIFGVCAGIAHTGKIGDCADSINWGHEEKWLLAPAGLVGEGQGAVVMDVFTLYGLHAPVNWPQTSRGANHRGRPRRFWRGTARWSQWTSSQRKRGAGGFSPE